MPVSWEGLPKLKSGAQRTIVTALEHLSFQTVDPWGDYWPSKQTLTVALKRCDAATRKLDAQWFLVGLHRSPLRPR